MLLGVNIDEAGNVPNDVTAALKAAGIITDANIANGSFNGELTATNMAALLTQLNSTTPPSPLAKLIDVSSYGIGDGSGTITFGSLSVQGGFAVPSPNHGGSGYVYELNSVIMGTSVSGGTPSLLTSNSLILLFRLMTVLLPRI